MEKQVYYVTDTAGPDVAGKRSPGTGNEISLTPCQAEHPLRQGYITDKAPARSTGRKNKKD
jgi:hypothetical protein